MADDGSQFPRVPQPLPTWEELNRRVSALSANVLERLEALELSVGNPANPAATTWHSNPPEGDWVPAGSNQWIGDENQSVRGVALGVPTGDPGVLGIQGAVMERTGSSSGEGGLLLLGLHDENASGTSPDPGLFANAPVEVSGVPVLVLGQAFIEVPSATTENRHLLIGSSTLLADGRHVVPLLVGPQYFPALEESATDARDISLDGIGTLEIVVTLGPLANTYALGVSSFLYEVRLSEEGDRTSDFDVEIWRSPGGGPYVQIFVDEFRLTGSALNVSQAAIVSIQIDAGDSIQMRVSAVGTHPNSDPWVRGATKESKLTIWQS